eukprot:CAMPEP_0198424826 /NCGR_PEP_ID=MMETSP1452-20131203/4147_1 /TAXON_ID=1181717 /ORGANISM="Synchroma pusillum, Strain CCMP3072" /LENGTH=49 /DNA_ID= /DNA_START= /DNA_END= /DNA_ORIENTATION=
MASSSGLRGATAGRGAMAPPAFSSPAPRTSAGAVPGDAGLDGGSSSGTT